MIPDQQARFDAVERLHEDKRGRDDYAAIVLETFIEGSEVSPGIEGAALVPLEDDHPCEDCGDLGTVYAWRNWPLLCSWCSYARLKNDGDNPRAARRAESYNESGRRGDV